MTVFCDNQQRTAIGLIYIHYGLKKSSPSKHRNIYATSISDKSLVKRNVKEKQILRLHSTQTFSRLTTQFSLTLTALMTQHMKHLPPGVLALYIITIQIKIIYGWSECGGGVCGARGAGRGVLARRAGRLLPRRYTTLLHQNYNKHALKLASKTRFSFICAQFHMIHDYSV